MPVSASPPVLSPGPGEPSSGGIICSDPFYTPTTTNRVISTTTATTTSECRMVDVHGIKVASFSVGGQDELICLPQVFDLFLKHLVGGLHTVYTKLKRLDICPVVCTVEQVRILRGLGAIQPGVNRCKLISRRDFEALYNDCTNARKYLIQFNNCIPVYTKIQQLVCFMELTSPVCLCLSPGGNECSWDKERLVSQPCGGGGVGRTGMGGQPRLNNQMTSLQQQLLANRLQDLPFMMIPHPLLPARLPPASVAMAMSQMNHLNTIANMAAAAHIHTHRGIKERVCDSPSPSPSLEDTHTPLLSQLSSHLSSTSSPDPVNHDRDLTERDIQKIAREKDSSSALPMVKPSFDRLSSGQALPPGFPAPFLFADGISSVETLLTNIQGLLKVAVESASVQDNQIQAEKRELKMELYRERELRESLERQLTSELQSRASMQKRLKKEKKLKRKLQEVLVFESKRRERVEDALKRWSSSSLSPPSCSNGELSTRVCHSHDGGCYS
uniref:SKI/SNO/DAC domain-containing protein n=1 Tax=Oncorhynchus mykiss TaxID=8022 RepID=A0A8K9V1E1_ONCMY